MYNESENSIENSNSLYAKLFKCYSHVKCSIHVCTHAIVVCTCMFYIFKFFQIATK